MNKGKRLAALPRMPQDVVQVILTIQIKCRVGIARQTVFAGMHQMDQQRLIVVIAGSLTCSRNFRCQTPGHRSQFAWSMTNQTESITIKGRD